jgi:polyisoprenoid-binding protein YceI
MLRPVARFGLITLTLTLAAVSPASAQANPAEVARASSRIPSTGTRWVVDPVHSQVQFRVRHLVGRVYGTFDDW